MAGWYQVVKTIKGHRYLYAQRTWREGGHVRTQSRYLGKAGDAGVVANSGHTAQAGLYDTLPDTIRKWVKPTDNLQQGSVNPQDFKKFTNVATDENVATFKKAYEAGTLEPVVVNKTKSGIAITDGQHRINAAKRAGLTNYPAIIVDKTSRGAQQPVPGIPEELPAAEAEPAGNRQQRDIYSSVTDAIIADLERGVRPWDRPWQVRAPTRPLRHNGEPYRGINIIMLWLSAAEQGFSSPHWMTYRQAQELGGHVRKGEKGTWIAYASTFTRIAQDQTGEPIYDDEGNIIIKPTESYSTPIDNAGSSLSSRQSRLCSIAPVCGESHMPLAALLSPVEKRQGH